MNEMEQRHREEIMDVLSLKFLKIQRFCCFGPFVMHSFLHIRLVSFFGVP
jgi:hypothetical protein